MTRVYGQVGLDGLNRIARQTPGLAEKLQRQIQQARKTLIELTDGVGEVVIEGGCGHGHFLSAYAQHCPGKRFFGVDVNIGRIFKARRKAELNQLSNLAFQVLDLAFLPAAWPDGLKIREAYILFPDPWPKKKHWKHRMLQRDLILTLSPLFAPGGRIFLRTDHPGMFDWCCELFQDKEVQNLWYRQTAGDDAWPFEHPTIFQEKAGNAFQSLVAVHRC